MMSAETYIIIAHIWIAISLLATGKFGGITGCIMAVLYIILSVLA
jgi:hypothetical protein